MLNELKEYDDWKKAEEPRWDTKFLSDLSGLRRPLTIIARHFLFEKDETHPDYARAEEALLAWLGKIESSDPEIRELNNGAVRNVQAMNVKKENVKVPSTIKKLHDKSFRIEEPRGDKPLEITSKKFNTDKQIFIEDVITQAACDGKLKNRCLVSDVDVFDVKIVDADAKDSLAKFIKQKDRFYKFIAAFLLSGGTEEIAVKLDSITLSNWFAENRFPGGLKGITMYGTEEPIFWQETYEYDNDSGNNNHRYCIDPTIIRHFSIEDSDKIRQRVKEDPEYLKLHHIYLDTSRRIVECKDLSSFDW